jgi:hypothetical protein
MGASRAESRVMTLKMYGRVKVVEYSKLVTGKIERPTASAPVRAGVFRQVRIRDRTPRFRSDRRVPLAADAEHASHAFGGRKPSLPFAEA